MHALFAHSARSAIDEHTVFLYTVKCILTMHCKHSLHTVHCLHTVQCK